MAEDQKSNPLHNGRNAGDSNPIAEKTRDAAAPLPPYGNGPPGYRNGEAPSPPSPPLTTGPMKTVDPAPAVSSPKIPRGRQ